MSVTDLCYKATLLEKILDPVHMEFQTHYTRLTTQKNCLFSIEEREYVTTARGTFIEIERNGLFQGAPPTPRRTCYKQEKAHFSVERHLWDLKKDQGVTEQYLCINGRPGAPQQKKVLVTGLCIFQTDNREFLQKGEGSGRTKKLAREPHAIPSHRCTRRWRKWTRQGGGWWRESSLEVYILKAYKKNHRGPKQRLAMGTGRSWNQRKVYERGGKNPKQTNLI